MSSEKLFSLPAFESLNWNEEHGELPYGLRNYAGAGPIARSKRARFERALRLDISRFGGDVVDMGCADGVLIPSLSKHYHRVTAIDIRDDFVNASQAIVKNLKLPNVEVFSNKELSWAELAQRVGPGFRSMFLLETLEHVGAQPDVWGSKMDFLDGCFSLLEDDGHIVISVPKMVGWIVLFKNLLQRSLRLGHDPLTFPQLLKSAILKNTDDLEPLWDGHHVGFNHLKLDQHLAERFTVSNRAESAISVFYVLSRK